MSIQVCGRRARLAKARSASASGENCDPISRMAPCAPPLRSISRRATNARKMVSDRSGLVSRSRRNCSGGTLSTRPARLTRALRYGRWPVSRFNSPTNPPGP